jgi:virulence-associated protein VapD
MRKSHSWFGKAARDIRMLGIEEHNDLLPAIARQELELDKKQGRS